MANSIAIWAGALCTFAIYSVLYKENKFYRLFEHLFIGLYGGYSIYITWSEILYPKWWQPMTTGGQWYWAFAAVVGSMFYFMYSRRHAWISRVVFGLLMGFTAGGIFREFYETYFPQMGASMKPLVTKEVLLTNDLHAIAASIANVTVFYIMLLAAMSYFFFSFEHKHAAVKTTAAAGRWFLMIGFGAMFGATVMGRMTLFIGRLNFLLNSWVPEVRSAWHHIAFQVVVIGLAVVGSILLFRTLKRSTRGPEAPAE